MRVATHTVEDRKNAPEERAPTGIDTRSAAALAIGPGPSAVQLAMTLVLCALVGGSVRAGWVDLSLVDVFVLLGVAVVLPLALDGTWEWLFAAGAVGASLRMAVGPLAAGLAGAWLVAGAMATARALRRVSWPAPSINDAASVVAGTYSLVAGFAFASSRLGLNVFGVGEPIVELTAVHYIYAGCAALVLAANALRHTDGRWARLGLGAVALTAAAPVIVATGFVARSALGQVGGAVAMAVGVWCTATLELRIAATGGRSRAERVLLFVSGAVIWLPMVLAVAWAAGQYWDFPALSIPAMERTHGVANSLGFVLAGLLAGWLSARTAHRRQEHRKLSCPCDMAIAEAA